MAEIEQPKYELILMDKVIRNRFLEVMSEQDYNRELNFAVQQLRGNPLLQKCAPTSIKEAVINVALVGVSLNPALQLAYLVPRKGRAYLDISYKGLIGIACNSGNVKSLAAQVVYEWDKFDFEMGTHPFLHYKMDLNPPVDVEELGHDPKKIWDHVVAAFSAATLLDGSVDFIVLPKYKLWKIYQTSEGKDNPMMPWATWPEEQIRKTAVKYHSKTLPRLTNEKLAHAVSILNQHEGLSRDNTGLVVMQRFGLGPKEQGGEIVEVEVEEKDGSSGICE